MSNLALRSDCVCILLVDDDWAVRVSMRRVLANAGHVVMEAGSGDAAAALIEGSTFDMLVTDVRMPGSRNGAALTSGWRKKVPGRPVLFVSGYPDGQLDLDSLGPNEAVLHKPFRGASLRDAVQGLLDKVGRRGRSGSGPN